jgi:hypothetical protein
MDLLKELGKKRTYSCLKSAAASMKAGESTGDPVMDYMVLDYVKSTEGELEDLRAILARLKQKAPPGEIKQFERYVKNCARRPRDFSDFCAEIRDVPGFRRRLERQRGRYVLQEFEAYMIDHWTVKEEAPCTHMIGYAWGTVSERGDVLLVDKSAFSGIAINTGGNHYRGSVMSPLNGEHEVCEGGIPYGEGRYVFGREAQKTVSLIERAIRAARKEHAKAGERPQV